VSLVIHNLGINRLYDLRVDLVDAEIDVGQVERTKKKRQRICSGTSMNYLLLGIKYHVYSYAPNHLAMNLLYLILSTIAVKKKGGYIIKTEKEKKEKREKEKKRCVSNQVTREPDAHILYMYQMFLFWYGYGVTLPYI